MKFQYYIFIAWLGLSTGRLQAASFDCTKATSAVETLVRNDMKLSTLDDELALAYRAATKRAANKGIVLAAQRSWLSARSTCANVECLNILYTQRISSLRPPQDVVIQSEEPARDVQNYPISAGWDYTTEGGEVELLPIKLEKTILCAINLKPS